MLNLSPDSNPIARSDLATLIEVLQNSAQFMFIQFPESSFQEMAFSLGYCSAFEIRYSGVDFADMNKDRTSVALTVYSLKKAYFSDS